MKLFSVSECYYKTDIHPRLIKEICNCYDTFKFKHGNLILWTGKMLFSYGNDPMEGFCSRGRLYCAEVV